MKCVVALYVCLGINISNTELFLAVPFIPLLLELLRQFPTLTYFKEVIRKNMLDISYLYPLEVVYRYRNPQLKLLKIPIYV